MKVLPATAEIQTNQTALSPGDQPVTETSQETAAGGSIHAASALSATFRTIYRDHFDMVWRSLLRLGVSPESVEDATQDVFLIVHRREREFEGRSSLKTWLYGISVRVAKDHRRASVRHRRRLLGMRQYVATIAERTLSPARQVEQLETARLTQLVLSEMNSEERDLLVLVELEGLSVSEASVALDLRLRTCQRRLSSARRNFEQRLEAAFGACNGPSYPTPTKATR